jgi:multiple sugar transport system substrate-binding protein
MSKKIRIVLSITALSMVFAAGCTKSAPEAKKETAPPAVSNEPVSLSVLQSSAKLTDEEFKMWFVDPVKKKYPNITLNLVREDNIEKLGQLVAIDNLPDIIYAGPVSAAKIVELEGAQDLTDAIKKNSVDLAKFEPSGIETIKQLSNSGKMFALPMAINFSALFYNKDIFDRFAVPYPKDDMTWDQAIELAKKLTRMDGGVQYRGLAIDGNMNRLGEQLSLSMVDPKTSKSALQTDGWKAVFETYRNIGQIPGNWLDNPQRIPAFQKEKSLAMLAGLSARLGEFESMQVQGQGMNWDMVTMPTFPQAPKQAFGGGVFYLMTSSNSKHQNEAFQVLKLLTDDESQTMLSKQGRKSSLKDAKFSQIFGDDLASLKGKNKQAIFKTVSAPAAPVTPYDQAAFNQLVAGGNTVAKDSAADVNTVIRQTDEKINQAIESLKK